MHAHTAYKDNTGVRQQEPSAAPRAPARSLANRRSARRLRHITRIQSAPDSAGRWALFVARIARLIDDDDVDWLLDAVVAADPAAVALYSQIDWGRS
jgi:hypothetical protein